MPVLRSGPHHPRLGPANPDRKRLLHRLWRAERVVVGVMLALIGRALLLPHARADLERLDHLRNAGRGVRELVAIRAIRDLLPPRAETEAEPPPAHHVDAGPQLRRQRAAPVGLR